MGHSGSDTRDTHALRLGCGGRSGRAGLDGPASGLYRMALRSETSPETARVVGRSFRGGRISAAPPRAAEAEG
jgi:hypothetical protein